MLKYKLNVASNARKISKQNFLIPADWPSIIIGQAAKKYISFHLKSFFQ